MSMRVLSRVQRKKRPCMRALFRSEDIWCQPLVEVGRGQLARPLKCGRECGQNYRVRRRIVPMHSLILIDSDPGQVPTPCTGAKERVVVVPVVEIVYVLDRIDVILQRM